jgi:putative ABC transport system permease protein
MEPGFCRVRKGRGVHVFDILKDIRIAGRFLVKSPGYAVVVAFTLALAIGANTIIFSFADLFLLRPLPLGDPARTVTLYSVDTQRGLLRARTSLPDFLDWRAETTAFEEMAAYYQSSYTLTGSGDPIRITALRATANLPSMWQLKTAAGRVFVPGEDAPGAAHVAVLSHRFWTQHFASDPHVIGRSLTLNGEPYTVVGVLTDAIEIGNMTAIDVWMPMLADPAGARRDARNLAVSARLKPGITVDQASTQVHAVASLLERAYPTTNAGWSARALSLRESVAGADAWIVLLMLGIVVVFVLVIACANVANMMLARATARAKEMAVRLALGASRLRLISQLMSESLLLGIAGGALGLGVALSGIRAIQAASNEPFFKLLVINGHVLEFAVALSVAAPLAFSILPALHASGADLNDALKEGGRRASGGAKGRRSRAVLVVSQLSLALMLLVVAGLVTRTMAAIEHVPTGIDSSHVLTAQVQLDPPKYIDAPRAAVFAEQLSERLRSLPGVRSAAVTSRVPIVDPEPAIRFQIHGQPPRTEKDRPWADDVAIGGDYLATFGIRLSAGRALSERDRATAPRVAMISSEAARRYWAGASPVGSQVDIVGDHDEHVTVQIVGVVDDVKPADLTEPMPPRIYRPLAQRPERALAFAVRTEGEPASVASAMREAIRAADPDLAVSRISPLATMLFDTFRENRVLVGMFAAFALVALVLSAAGLYGVTAYAVSQRTQEIGIRMALGATAGDVLRMIVGQNARLVGAGAIIGVLGGLGLGSAMRSILYRVGATDPATFGAVLAVLTIVALAASYVPARRATRVDPLKCLRND